MQRGRQVDTAADARNAGKRAESRAENEARQHADLPAGTGYRTPAAIQDHQNPGDEQRDSQRCQKA